jgi:hypothetical protein
MPFHELKRRELIALLGSAATSSLANAEARPTSPALHRTSLCRLRFSSQPRFASLSLERS